MKTSQDIWNDAKRSAQTYNNIAAIKADGTYNTSFMLSHEHIKAAALMRIAELQGITFDEASKKCFIDGISIKNANNITIEQIEDFFSDLIRNAINNTNRKLPSFLSIDDGYHFILIGLLPTNRSNEIIITYNNSIPDEEEHLRRGTGRVFASQLVNYLKERHGIDAHNNGYVDLSKDQQYDNCCGLSVANNIATITTNFVIGQSIEELVEPLFKPKDSKEKEQYYKNFGKTFFQKLNEQNSPVLALLSSSERILEELMHKYKLRLRNNAANTPKDNVIAELFAESKTKLVLLNIYPCENLDKVQIPSLKGKSNLTCSRIGEEEGNNLIMVQTTDNKIYFDEGKNNKFTGLVFIDRIDPTTGKHLNSKDIIRYKNGKVIELYEGEQGISRLGQLDQFKVPSIGYNVNADVGITASSSCHHAYQFQRNNNTPVTVR
ncbi:MAG: hypothetical protein AB8U25_05140 [Rickettsiales endosymbiont of Dermacentor nuttalli]